jgi:hypothetical protein
MEKYNHWRVTIKEKAMKHPITTELHGNYDEKDVVDFYGLKQPDVEWYKMENLNDKKE